jgi:Family of unknown function (DUF6502)
MRQQERNRKPQPRSSRKVSLNPQSMARVEGLLTEILTDLAKVLVVSGYGISGLTRLTKLAYLNAAQALEQAQSGRASHARVAALTGLTRTEVSKLSRGIPQIESEGRSPANRAQRVSLGWANDPDYCEKSGSPKVLPFSRGRKSFESLVKRYSGDIPVRAMFLEMSRLGMILETPSKHIRLVRASPPVKSDTVNALAAIMPWTKFLADGQSDEARDLSANTVRLELNFESLPQLFSTVRELQERANVFIASIQELSAGRSKRHSHKLHVSIALATRVPRDNSSTKRGAVRKSHVEA